MHRGGWRPYGAKGDTVCRTTPKGTIVVINASAPEAVRNMIYEEMLRREANPCFDPEEPPGEPAFG